MTFEERSTSPGWNYKVEDLFGILTIQSDRQLDAKQLDKITAAILSLHATEGTIAEGITFTFVINSQWQDDEEPVPSTMSTSPKQRTVALVSALFFGTLGLHRFYVGKVGSGFCLLLLTLTGAGLVISIPWVVIDLLTILFGGFRDAEHRPLTVWLV